MMLRQSLKTRTDAMELVNFFQHLFKKPCLPFRCLGFFFMYLNGYATGLVESEPC